MIVVRIPRSRRIFLLVLNALAVVVLIGGFLAIAVAMGEGTEKDFGGIVSGVVTLGLIVLVGYLFYWRGRDPVTWFYDRKPADVIRFHARPRK